MDISVDVSDLEWKRKHMMQYRDENGEVLRSSYTAFLIMFLVSIGAVRNRVFVVSQN